MKWNPLSIPRLQLFGLFRSLEIDKWFYCTLDWGFGYLSMLGLKLIHVRKQGSLVVMNEACDLCMCVIGRYAWYSTYWPLGNITVILKMSFSLIVQNSCLGTHLEIALRWMPMNLTMEKWTLVQVMAWCHQAPSHYLGNVGPDLCHHMASLGLNR